MESFYRPPHSGGSNFLPAGNWNGEDRMNYNNGKPFGNNTHQYNFQSNTKNNSKNAHTETNERIEYNINRDYQRKYSESNIDTYNYNAIYNIGNLAGRNFVPCYSESSFGAATINFADDDDDDDDDDDILASPSSAPFGNWMMQKDHKKTAGSTSFLFDRMSNYDDSTFARNFYLPDDNDDDDYFKHDKPAQQFQPFPPPSQSQQYKPLGHTLLNTNLTRKPPSPFSTQRSFHQPNTYQQSNTIQPQNNRQPNEMQPQLQHSLSHQHVLTHHRTAPHLLSPRLPRNLSSNSTSQSPHSTMTKSPAYRISPSPNSPAFRPPPRHNNLPFQSRQLSLQHLPPRSPSPSINFLNTFQHSNSFSPINSNINSNINNNTNNNINNKSFNTTSNIKSPINNFKQAHFYNDNNNYNNNNNNNYKNYNNSNANNNYNNYNTNENYNDNNNTHYQNTTKRGDYSQNKVFNPINLDATDIVTPRYVSKVQVTNQEEVAKQQKQKIEMLQQQHRQQQQQTPLQHRKHQQQQTPVLPHRQQQQQLQSQLRQQGQQQQRPSHLIFEKLPKYQQRQQQHIQQQLIYNKNLSRSHTGLSNNVNNYNNDYTVHQNNNSFSHLNNYNKHFHNSGFLDKNINIIDSLKAPDNTCNSSQHSGDYDNNFYDNHLLNNNNNINNDKNHMTTDNKSNSNLIISRQQSDNVTSNKKSNTDFQLYDNFKNVSINTDKAVDHKAKGSKEADKDGIDNADFNDTIKGEADDDDIDVEAFATSLFHLQGFTKQEVPPLINKPTDGSKRLREAYLGHFDFSGQSIEQSLRSFVATLSVTGESQEQERVLEAFSSRFLHCNPTAFKSLDSCHTLTCAIFLLNTDLHGQNVGKRMTQGQFSDNLRGLNGGDNYEAGVLKQIYSAIHKNPLPLATSEDKKEEKKKKKEKSNQFLQVQPGSSSSSSNSGSCGIVFKRGLIVRKACLGPDGRKTPMGKRGWKLSQAILRDTSLIFSKDVSSKSTSRQSEEPDPSSDFLLVHHSLAYPAKDYIKKKHVFELRLANWAVYLIRTSSDQDCQQWMQAINLSAAFLSAPPLPAPVGSSMAFQRPLLPSSFTKLSLADQLRGHEERLKEVTEDLAAHHDFLGGVVSKAKKERDAKETFLLFERLRYQTYIQILKENYSKLKGRCKNGNNNVNKSISSFKSSVDGMNREGSDCTAINSQSPTGISHQRTVWFIALTT